MLHILEVSGSNFNRKVGYHEVGFLIYPPHTRTDALIVSYVYVLLLSAVFLTNSSRGRLEKLIVTQLVKKFPQFYGTRSFITVFSRARH
jgi:hypothetical protein